MSELAIKIIICFVISVTLFLPIMIAVQWNKRRPLLQRNENTYVMYHPKSFFRAMVLCVIGDYVFMVVGIVIYDDASILIAILLFGVGAVVSECLGIYGLLWRAVVDEDSMTIYAPCFPVRYFKFYEITKVKQMKDDIVKDRLIAYVKGKKVFEIEEDVAGFYVLYEQLCRAGKIEYSRVKESFTVKNTKGNLVRDSVGAIIMGGLFIALLVVGVEDLEFIYYIGIGSMAIICSLCFILEARWKIVVTYSTLYIRTGFGKEKAYAIRDITAVHQLRDEAILYSDKKKVVKISATHENYSLLLDRLRSLQITFYKN